MNDWLVVWKVFFHIGNFIIPTDEINFFRGVGQPPTSTGWGHQDSVRLPYKWLNSMVYGRYDYS